MQDAIAYYHELLTDELAQASEAMLSDQLRRRGLVFGDRPVATVLRPRFMTLAHYRLLQRRVRLLMRAFGKAYERALADQAFRRQFRLADWEERLIRHDPGFLEPSPTSRVDAFVMDEAGTMAVTEYNAETPAGAGYNDALVAVLRRPAGHAGLRAPVRGDAAPGTARRAPRAARRVRDLVRPPGHPPHRHRGLARGPDPQRVRAVPGVLRRGGHRVRSSPTRARWSCAAGGSTPGAARWTWCTSGCSSPSWSSAAAPTRRCSRRSPPESCAW